MKAAAYDIERVASIDIAAAALRDGGWGVKPIAGGQSLGAMLNLRLAQPEKLLDLDGLEALREVVETDAAVTLGAMTTHSIIEDRRVPDASRGLMPTVARSIAYRAVRNRGTLGGSLCHADPAADWVSTMPLLGASLALAGPQGRRDVAAAQFMQGAFETQMAEGELLVSITIPKCSGSTRWAYRKFCRKTGEFAHALVGLLVDPARDVERVVLGALDGSPRVIDQPGLHRQLVDATWRSQWLGTQTPGLDRTRRLLLNEMMRLALDDLEISR